MKSFEIDRIEYESRLKRYEDENILGNYSCFKNEQGLIRDIKLSGDNEKSLRKVEKDNKIRYFFIDTGSLENKV